MKIFKKIICLLLVLSLTIFNNNSFSNASTIQDNVDADNTVSNTKEEIISLLLDAGMEIDDINKLPEEKFDDLKFTDSIQINTTYLKVLDKNVQDTNSNIYSIAKLNSNLIPDTVIVPLSKEEFYNEVSMCNNDTQNSESFYSTDPTDPNPTYTASGYLKQSILFAKTGTKYRYNVSFIGDWVVSSRPNDRGTDVFGFYVKNATKVGSVSTHYRAKADDINQTPIYESLTGSVKTSLDGAATSCKLNNWSTDNYLYMSFDVTADSVSQGYMYVIGEYYHQQKFITFTPSFSVSSDGISISGTVEQKQAMVFMNPNPSARYYFD